ncbi:hypothetical protein IFM89_010700 [Coptis chinensis]|uniref:Secreted protein n=1 Tax=Coptis chinensis TaxID=261450 RepID=A0A835M5K5_9MAGN|nr:hypothetical protein IFM89_010700 [Coptis chinensis]
MLQIMLWLLCRRALSGRCIWLGGAVQCRLLVLQRNCERFLVSKICIFTFWKMIYQNQLLTRFGRHNYQKQRKAFSVNFCRKEQMQKKSCKLCLKGKAFTLKIPL